MTFSEKRPPMVRKSLYVARDHIYHRAKAVQRVVENDLTVAGSDIGQSLNLNRDEWRQLSPEDRADITEFIVNAHADYFFAKLPESDFHEKFDHAAQLLQSAVEDFIRDIDALSQGISHDSNQENRELQESARQCVTALQQTLLKIPGSQGIRTTSYTTEFLIMHCQRYAQAVIERDVEADEKLRFKERIGKESENMLQQLGEHAAIDFEFTPLHDAFHYLAVMKEHDGEAARPYMTEHRAYDSYTQSEGFQEELYAFLFMPTLGRAPYPVILNNPTLRINFYNNQFHARDGHDARVYSAYIMQLAKAPGNTVEERMKDYEQILKYRLLLAIDILNPEISVEDRAKIAHFFDTLDDTTRPPYYTAFARRVFAKEYETNPRLFIDEMLGVIRKPGNHKSAT